jgi:integrase
VIGAVEAHLQWMRDRGLRASTVERAERHLHHILQTARHGQRPIRWLTPKVAETLYLEAQVGRSVDTHRNELAAAKALGKWCAKREWLKANPFADVAGLGRRNHGKPRLTMDESRRLLAYCVANPSPEATITAGYLLLGVRASELVTRNVRDIDDQGRVLVVPTAKTRRGVRDMVIPEVLRTLLLELVRGRPADAPLFASSAGGRRDRTWAYRAVRATCAAAGVPEVSPQGLRGTHGTAARAAHQTPEVVAAALGHGVAVSERAYVDPVEAAAADARAAWRVLEGGRR